MNEVISKQKKSCLNGYHQIKIGDVDKFINEGKRKFGINHRHKFIQKMRASLFNEVEISAFNSLFKQYGVTENIWTDVD